MTNAEAAKYFASLPPNKKAEIVLLDGDSMWAESYNLDGTISKEVAEKYEGGDDHVGKIFIFRKY